MLGRDPDLFEELKRRNVFRAAAMYAVVAWLVVQVADATFEVLGVPESAHRILILVVAAGFPIAVVLGWLFDWTAQGLVRTSRKGGDEVERLRGRRRIDFAIIAVLVLALGMSLVDSRSEPAVGAGRPTTSLVVLPFDDMSPQGGQAHFAHGMSEELMSVMAGLPGVRVIGRTSAEAVKRKGMVIEQIGRELGVDAVVEGSVRRSRDRVRINVQLLRATDGVRLWSDSYDRPMGDLFELQTEISADVATAMDLRLKAEAYPAPTENLEAYDAYLTGRYLMGRQTPEALIGAVEHFERATRADPEFALAWSGLSDVLSLSWTLGVLNGDNVVARAIDAAAKAVSARPDSAETQTSLGRIQWLNRDWRASEASLRKAIEINPGYAFAYQSLALVLMNLGEFEEGIAMSHRSVDLEPLSPYMNVNLAYAYNSIRDHETALRYSRRASALEHENFFARFSSILSLYHLERPEDMLEETLAIGLPDKVEAMLRAGFASNGTDAIFQMMLAQSVAQTRDECAVQAGAMFHALLGNREAALSCFENGVQYPGRYANVYPAHDPVFDSLRGEPRFNQALAQMKLVDRGRASDDDTNHDRRAL
jgi:TolB-like protein